MPRPKIYKNAAQKKAASKLKSKRYYWNHREQVLSRVKAYQQSQQMQPARDEEGARVAKGASEASGQVECSSISDPISEARRLCLVVLNKTKSNPLHFVHCLYEDTLKCPHSTNLDVVGSLSLLSSAVSLFTSLSNSTLSLLNNVLQYDGAGTVFNEAESISSTTRTILACLEDIQCAILLEDVLGTYERGEYLFQQSQTRLKLLRL
ncbi:hypothetical protein V5O48_015395 [Marasmius crinis-equi]|uniref:Uncharacterized protein n=1 Tax=Marasmius crinis-equi TaxID=585013 RepID=A0ABR3EUZ3_9AGAR